MDKCFVFAIPKFNPTPNHSKSKLFRRASNHNKHKEKTPIKYIGALIKSQIEEDPMFIRDIIISLLIAILSIITLLIIG